MMSFSDFWCVYSGERFRAARPSCLKFYKHCKMYTFSKLWSIVKHLYFVKPILVGTVHLQDLLYEAGERYVNLTLFCL